MIKALRPLTRYGGVALEGVGFFPFVEEAGSAFQHKFKTPLGRKGQWIEKHGEHGDGWQQHHARGLCGRAEIRLKSIAFTRNGSHLI